MGSAIKLYSYKINKGNTYKLHNISLLCKIVILQSNKIFLHFETLLLTFKLQPITHNTEHLHSLVHIFYNTTLYYEGKRLIIKIVIFYNNALEFGDDFNQRRDRIH